MMRTALLASAFAALASVTLSFRAAALEGDGAILQGLDKVTARISTIEAPLDQPVRFGTLEITALRCTKTPPEEPPESAAFLVVREIRTGEQPVELFRGWMMASSPALSALGHPVYDVWVKDCRNARSDSSRGPR
ncbi:MAG: DUF2155 domain-containing protein [Gemmatimonas sp.]